ncbi:MAG: hypothetical protein ABI772_05910 [Bacteroidota bacterium]
MQLKTSFNKVSIAGMITFLALMFLCNTFSYGVKVSVSFRDEQSKYKAGEMASNVLRVVNGSEKKINFYLSLSIPENWTTTKSFDALYQVNAGDSLFIPVKLLLKGKDNGSTSYFVSAGLIDESSKLQFASASWYLAIESESNWVATADHADNYFINNSDTSSFTFSIRNTGNAIEWYTVKLTPHFQLKILDSKMNEVPQYFNISLLPGADTVFNFTTKLKATNMGGFQRGSQDDYKSSETYPVRIAVQATNKDQSPGRIWKTTVSFKRNRNEIKFNQFSRQVLPMTMEMRIDNLLEASTSLSLNFYGTTFLSRSRTLVYRFQTFFSQQYYNEKAFRGNYHYIGYFTRKGSVEVGNITGWRNFGLTPSGRGVKGEYKIGKNKIGALYIQNPDLFTNPSVRTIGLRDEFELNKSLTLVGYYQQSYNNISKLNGMLGVAGADFKLTPVHIFSGRFGYSTEKYYEAIPELNVTGYGGSFGYSGQVRAFGLRFSADYGSKDYSGYRGIINLSSGASWKKSERYTWSTTHAWYHQEPVYYNTQGVRFDGLKSTSRRHELRLQVNNKTSNHSFRAAWYDDDLLNIHYITKGLGFDFHPSMKSQVRFVSTFFGSYVNLPDYDIPGYFTAQVRSTIRYKSFNANMRYNYGPYQAFEHIRFAKYGINHQSIFLNAYYGMWLMPGTLSLEPTVNYSYESIYRKGRLGLRPELFYYAKSGWQFNIYAEFLVSSQKIVKLENSNRLNDINNEPTSYKDLTVGVGLKKDFGIPIPGKRFNTATITAFRDLNGNMKQDKNEESLENVLITIKPEHPDSTGDMVLDSRGQEVITDNKGIAIFRNLPAGIYIITSLSLTENSGWFPTGNQTIVLDKNKTIPVAFSKGVHLGGGIGVDYNVHSANTRKPEISRIRVTAVDSAGRVYSTLTDNDGHFDLFVPMGDYRISINQNAIDGDFILDQNMIILSLTGKVESYHVSFRIREKERSFKVKKFSKDGTLVEENQ